MTHLHEPEGFVAALREFQSTPEARRGQLANALSDAIIRKHIDLALVRQKLIDAGEISLYETLDELLSLIEPYLEETGDTE